MVYILLDAERLADRKTAHAYLKARFDFPDFYGENLDALYDLLTETSRPIYILIHNLSADVEIQAAPIIGTIEDAAGNNASIVLEIL